MNNRNIKNIIRDVINQDIKCKSILIDGNWGSGKTTAIKEAIKELSDKEVKKKIYYQSLFGIKDVAELSACYSYAGKIIYSIGKTIAPFVKLIPIVGDHIKESIDNGTEMYEPKPKEKKNRVFIFDDLERTDASLSYVSLLGFFNQLLLRGCIIICVSALNDLERFDKYKKNRTEEMEAFVEKAFDRIIYINEKPKDIIENLFSEIKPAARNIHQCSEMFEGNIRLAIKAKRLLLDIYDDEKEEFKYSLNKKFSDLQVLKAVVCAIRAIHLPSTKNKQEKKDESNNMAKLFYKYDDKPLDERIGQRIIEEINDGIFYLQEEKEDIKELSRCLCYMEAHFDDSELLKNYTTQKENKNELYDSVFYLNDEGKKESFEYFKQNVLNGKVEVNKRFSEKTIEFIKYTDFDFEKDGLLDSIVALIADTAIKGDSSALNRFEDYITFPNEGNDRPLIKEIFNKSKYIIKERGIRDTKVEIEKYISEDDYSSLANLSYDIIDNRKPQYMKESFDRLLLDNHFYLPDLSKSIDYHKWSYCHQIARYSAGNSNLSEPFIEEMRAMVDNHPGSKSVVEKTTALIQYNFKQEVLEEFKKYIQSKNNS